MRFLHFSSSLPRVTPQSPSPDANPGLMSGLAHGGPTDSERHGESEARQGWNLPKWIANLASICHYAFSSPRPATIAAALIAVCLLALPACAGAAVTYTVTTLADSTDANPACTTATGNTCSLRDAIGLADSNSGATIVFAPGLTGTIYINDGGGNLLNIISSMTIQGPGANLLTVDLAYDNYFDITTGTVNISGLTITDGSNADIYNYGGQVTINGCVLTGESIGPPALLNVGVTSGMTVTNSLIYGNSSTSLNGGGVLNSGTLTVSNSTITGNTAAYWGGGIYNIGTLTVSNSTITGNTANASTSPGTGIDNNGGTVTITSSIVAGNSSNGVSNFDDCESCGTQSTHNIIGGTPPALRPLAWNGGPMKTILPLYGSTAIGAGSSASGEPATDQRGFPRPTSGAIDLGAVQTHYLTVNTTADTNDGTCTLTTCSLRDALEQAAIDGEGDIQFNATGTIFLTLAKPLPAIAEDLNIVGPGASKLTINANSLSNVGSVLTISSIGNGFPVAISGVTITGANIPATDNSSGGGITSFGLLTVSNSVISGNTSANDGAGIASLGGTLLVDNSTISGNSARDGGAIYSDSTNVTVNNSTISGNTITSNGGGIDGYNGRVLVNNSTISGNVAAEGGGIYFNCASSGSCGGVTVNNSTISANASSTIDGGGIYSASGTVTLNNSIVAGNAAGGKANDGDCLNCGTQSQYNFIGGNPQLSPLQLNGRGTTLETMIPLPGSPVIGAAVWNASSTINYWTPDLSIDERGFPRPLSTHFDLGAVQTNYTLVTFTSTIDNVAVNQNIAPAITAKVIETNELTNTIDGVAGVPVTLTYSGGASEIVNASSLTATTDATGTASFSGIAINTAGTNDTFTVASPVLVATTETSNSFNVLAPAATPTFLPAAGTYNTVQTVTITSTTPSATIFYTTDGSTPTPSSSLYGKGPITVSSSETVQAIVVAPGYGNSPVASAAYNLMAATPTFSPSGRTFTSVQTVTISSKTPSATIYYTLDGSTPTTSSNVANGPITVSSSETISAIAVAAGFTNSIVTSSAYTINLPQAATPTFLPAAGTYTSAQSVTISSTDMSAMIYYTTDGSTPTANSTLNRGPITVSASETIKAIAIAPGFVNSTIATAAYNLPISFAVAVTPATLSVTSGQSGTATVSVTPQNGFATAVILTCSGLPAGASCSFSPASVTPSGTAASTSMLTVNTSGETAVLHRNSNPLVPVSTLAAAFCFLGWKKRRKVQLMLLLAVSVIGLSLFTGCGGSSSTSKTPVVSTITVTGTSGTGASQLQNSTTFSLTVN